MLVVMMRGGEQARQVSLAQLAGPLHRIARDSVSSSPLFPTHALNPTHPPPDTHCAPSMQTRQATGFRDRGGVVGCQATQRLSADAGGGAAHQGMSTGSEVRDGLSQRLRVWIDGMRLAGVSKPGGRQIQPALLTPCPGWLAQADAPLPGTHAAGRAACTFRCGDAWYSRPWRDG